MTATRFEVGAVYHTLNRIMIHRFIKVIKRNDETGRITYQECDRDGNVYGKKRVTVFDRMPFGNSADYEEWMSVSSYRSNEVTSSGDKVQ